MKTEPRGMVVTADGQRIYGDGFSGVILTRPEKPSEYDEWADGHVTVSEGIGGWAR